MLLICELMYSGGGGEAGASYLVKGDRRDLKKDERVQQRNEGLYNALRLDVTW